ncbi:hypothetical protein SAMN05443572_102327 [Myxococcus fulvus]|uniref:Uncharacterized protein n=1 Tax=Myxococcus fulvus TaxID=33 RepID=A0A511SYM7_MYXFU|nr:hypothetical protein [Myxococcus fulvus]GEN06562.1 hypothetical protein MFU01_15990 [Myxococcus fulvus]SET45124.1 hypothetical protein SAMN05443572_102327 [Myxococcus fulvus]
MEATRVGRVRRPARKEEVPVAPPPPPVDLEATVHRPLLVVPLERYALVAWVLGRGRAGELLEGLGTGAMRRAKVHLRNLSAMPSAQRQAKVAMEFGERADAAARLKALMEEVPEALRKEVFRRLPPYHRTLFPGRVVEPVDPEAPPLLTSLAERLIREATR